MMKLARELLVSFQYAQIYIGLARLRATQSNSRLIIVTIAFISNNSELHTSMRH